MGTHTSAAAREEVNPKATARREAQRHQAKLHPDWVRRASLIVRDHVLARPEWTAARAVAAYVAQLREVQTADLIESAYAAGKRVCVPAWRADQQGYAFAWLARDAGLKPGRMGILEPTRPDWVNPSDLDLVLVPVVAFDAHGRRLGHGGGHFDRLLSRCPAVKVGLAFEAQRLAAVPVEAHDVGLDLVVTETGAHGPRAGRA